MGCHKTELLYSQEHHYMSKEVGYRMGKESLSDIPLTQDEYLEYEKKSQHQENKQPNLRTDHGTNKVLEVKYND